MYNSYMGRLGKAVKGSFEKVEGKPEEYTFEIEAPNGERDNIYVDLDATGDEVYKYMGFFNYYCSLHQAQRKEIDQLVWQYVKHHKQAFKIK
ncbi:hypothetical protein [Bacillus cereus]|uniref:hypothetical protein n=1 Tax=Bacillus cereus TaxID=1396 RepID=UPI002ABF2989|nr:hypothetical protein [Bacillus cereus]MDZ4567453.1 hypothetical protein [Bacillus cereus]